MVRIGHLIKNRFLQKMVALYLCIFLLPTVIISVFVLRYTMTQFGQRLMNQQALIFANSLERIERLNETCQSIIAQLSPDDTLCRDMEMYSNQSSLQKTLQQLTSPHSDLRYIWCYIPETDCFLSGSDSLTINRLETARYTFAERSTDLGILESLKNGISLQAYDNYCNTPCILMPYTIVHTHANRICNHLIVFQVNQESLIAELRTTLGTSCGKIALFDASGNLLAAYEHDLEKTSFPDDLLLAPLDISDIQVSGHFWSGHNHLQLAMKTIGKRWSMTGLYMDASGTANMFSLQQILMLVFASLFALGMIAVVVIIYKLYMPVHSIRAAAAQTGWQKTDEVIDDDYEYIESCIEQIAVDNAGLQEILRERRRRNREMSAGLLFEGRVRNHAELEILCEDYALRSVDGQYWLVGFLTDVDSQRMYTRKCVENDHFPPVMCFQDGCLLLLFDEPSPEKLDLPNSASPVRIIQASEFVDIPKNCAVVLLLLSCNVDALEDIPLVEQETIMTAVLDDKDISALRKWYIETEKQSPLRMARTLAWLVLTVYETVEQGRIEVPEWFYLPENLPATVCQERGKWFCDLLESWIAVKPEEKGGDFERMKAYIAAQFDSPDFSIKKMAQDFSMSISSLSAFFKRREGVLLSDYIAEMKMEKAKFLLKNTSMSINDISLAVGYYNVNSFTRRFQQRVGVSPREFRSSEE